MTTPQKASESPWIIESEKLAAGYVPGKLILNDVTANVHRGKITCVIGGSGSIYSQQ